MKMEGEDNAEQPNYLVFIVITLILEKQEKKKKIIKRSTTNFVGFLNDDLLC